MLRAKSDLWTDRNYDGVASRVLSELVPRLKATPSPSIFQVEFAAAVAADDTTAAAEHLQQLFSIFLSDDGVEENT